MVTSGLLLGGEEPLSAQVVRGMSAVGAAGAAGRSMRGLSVAWPIATIGAVFYGSLLPFHVDWSAFRPTNAFGLLEVGLLRSDSTDALINVLVYIPVGLLLALSGRGDIGRRLARLPRIVFVGATVSVMAEVVQTGITSRCASWIDVAFNVTGTTVGAILGAVLFNAVVKVLRTLRRGMMDRPFTTLSSMLTVGLVLYCLAPFDFVTNTAGLHASFLRARWDLIEPRLTPFGEPPYAMMLEQLMGAAWFAGLGYFLALAAVEKKRFTHNSPPSQCKERLAEARGAGLGHRLRVGRLSSQDTAHTRAVAFGSALTQGLAVAVVIECLQLFTHSHVFDLAALMLRGLAVGLSAWWAVFVAAAAQSQESHAQLRRAVPTAALVALAACHSAALVLISVQVSMLRFDGVDWTNVRWIPFEALWLCPVSQAVTDTLSTLANYAVLALVLAVFMRRTSARGAWFKTGILLFLLALAVEGLHLPSAVQTADITDPLLALLAVIGISRAYPLLRPGSPVVAG